MPRSAPSKNLLLLGGVLVLGVAARYYGDRTYASAASFHFRMPRDANDAETWIVICLAALAGSFVGAVLGYRLNRVTAAIMGAVGGAAATAYYSSILGGLLGAPIGLLVAWLGPRRMVIDTLACVVAAIAGVCGGAVAGAISVGPVEPVPLFATMFVVLSAVAALNVFVVKRFSAAESIRPWRRVASRSALLMMTLSVAVVGIPLGITFESLVWLRSVGGVGFFVEPRSLDAAYFTRGFCNDVAWTRPGAPRESDLPKLRRFDGISMFRLRGVDIGDESLKLFREFPHLWHLDLSETRVTDKGVRDFTGIRFLRSLNLSGTRVTAECLSHLPPALDDLLLAGTAVTDESLKQLTTLPLSSRLVLKDTPIGDAGVANLRGLGRLQGLDLSETRITDAALATLAKNQPVLRSLELRETGITSAGLAHLGALRCLSWLDVSYCAIADESIDDLAACMELFELRISGTRITPQGIARLREALPDCNVECE